jgi:hypothetical protein
MVKAVKPAKEQVREYMLRRQGEHKPPPSCEEIRRALGWSLDGPGCDGKCRQQK